MEVIFLGTGTSTGVPQIGCHCAACTSHDPRDKRLRASVLIRTDRGNNILIDCGPDFREQMLRLDSPPLSALLITHSHYDHVGGIDDLRPYCADGPFPVWCRADVERDLRARVPYCFAEHLYPGVPTYNIHTVHDDKPFSVFGDTVIPLPVMHAHLHIVGYRIGDFAYITDCKTISDSTIALIRGVDTLVINALRHEEHMSHLNLQQALGVIKAIGPRATYLTHLAHQMGPQAEVEPTLPPGVHIAFDGLTIRV